MAILGKECTDCMNHMILLTPEENERIMSMSKIEVKGSYEETLSSSAV
eukprot:CAMPEP_0194431462 /NCGR_PEP_ID=MMETSP0176-20130528/63610_1 /TAXON_ID=216777 /ORGANISM="Proboscia alata, Strain PI-D3" /LENGTH=47 /DNA_ID= /DNA_START= /DNA_END= /DNA_ORIENTATION=